MRFVWGYLLLVGLLILLAVSVGISPLDIFTVRMDWHRTVRDILTTFARVTISVSISWMLSVVIGKLMHASRTIHRLLMPSINFIRHISPYVWLPFAILWFGIGEPPLYSVMITALVFTGILMAYEMFQTVPDEYLDEAMICGANRLKILWFVELPVLRSSLLNLYRILWGVGWTAVIAAEMLGVQDGIGFRLLDYRFILAYPQMIRCVMMIGLIGVLVDRVLEMIVRKVEW